LSNAQDLPELLALHREHRDQFDYFHVGTFWSNFKKLPRGQLGGLSDRLAPVCEQTVLMLPELNARALANLAHAFAKTGLVGTGPWQNVWAGLPEAIRRLIRGFDPQTLSNTAWAFAKADYLSTELFNVILAEVVRRELSNFNPQDLSNTAWAFATTDHLSTELFQAISAEVVRRGLGDFNPQGLSNTAWAFAKAGYLSTELFNVISAEVVRRRMDGFKEQELSNTAWAFAKAEYLSTELFQAISAEVMRRGLNDFNPQDLSNTAWAFAKAGHLSTELFKTISTEVVRRGLGDFNPQDLSNTAWAFAKAGHLSTELFKTISAEVVRRELNDFSPQGLSNTAWAPAIADPPSADALFGTACFSKRCAHFETYFSRSELSQLHQWSLWREERGAQWPGLPESLQHACRNAFVEEGGQPSQLQSDVVEEIRSSYDIANVEEEHRCEVSGYSIDALVTLNDGERIAVEVDGPSHFVGRSQQPNGGTLLKHRQLRYFGWRLEDVKYWEWDHSKELPWLPQRSR
jgi:hypothetical protein